MIDFFYGFCINDTDLQEITKTEVGITKTEVADFWLLYKNKSLTIYLNRPSVTAWMFLRYHVWDLPIADNGTAQYHANILGLGLVRFYFSVEKLDRMREMEENSHLDAYFSMMENFSFLLHALGYIFVIWLESESSNVHECF